MKLTFLKRKLLRKRWLSIPIIIPIVIVIAGGGAWAALQLGGSNPEANTSTAINLQKGLIAWYKLNGNYKDSTPYSDDATVSGTAPATVADHMGTSGGAEYFNGSGYLVTPNIDVSGGAYTVSLWVNVDSFTSNQGGGSVGLVGNTNGSDSTDEMIHLGIRNYHAWLGQYGDDLQGTSTLTTNTWYNIVYMITASKEQEIYINGTLNASRTAGGFLGDGLDQFASGPFDGNLNGSLSDVRVYNRALSPAEVTALYQEYNSGIKPAQGETGLLAWWKLDGNAKDSSPNANDGTVNGASPTTDREGQADGAYNFNGSSNYISTPLIPTSSQLTVSAWFMANSLTGDNPRLVADGHTDSDHKGFQLMFNNGGKTGFFDVGNGSSTGSASWNQQLVTGQWYQYVGVYDGSHIYAYLNGVLVASGSYSGGAVASDGVGTSIGYDSQYGSDYFNGSMSDVRIYGSALSATQISTLYNEYNSQVELGGSGSSGSVSLGKGLVAYWPLNGNTKDATPYANDCTNNGAGLTNDRMGRADSAYAFNGSNNTLTCGASSLTNIDSPKSFSAWFNYSGGGVYDILTTNGGSSGNQLRIDGGKLEVSEWGGGILLSSSTTISQNTWHLATFTYDGTTDRLYLDGTQIASGTNTPQSGAPTVVYIGSYGSGEYFNGSIDDVRIYNRALNVAEAQALYQNYD